MTDETLVAWCNVLHIVSGRCSSCPTPGPGYLYMGDRLRTGEPANRLTQPPTISGMGNEY